jgi:hypothetical protein
MEIDSPIVYGDTMSFDIQSARVRVGLESTDTSKDPQITGALNAALSIAENYTDRFFVFKEEEARFYYDSSNVYTLKRYPISEILELKDSDGSFPEYRVHKLFGRLELKNYNRSEDLFVRYTAGYAPFPADLELALWGIFDATFASIDKAMSGEGITGGNGTGYGDIQSINIPDVGTVSFASTSSSVTTSAVAAQNALWGRFGPFFMLLDAYKDHSC